MADTEHIKGESQQDIIHHINELNKGYASAFNASSTQVIVYRERDKTGIEVIDTDGNRSRFYIPHNRHEVVYESHTSDNDGKGHLSIYHPTGEVIEVQGHWENATNNQHDGQNFIAISSDEEINPSTTHIRRTKIRALLVAINELDYD